MGRRLITGNHSLAISNFFIVPRSLRHWNEMQICTRFHNSVDLKSRVVSLWKERTFISVADIVWNVDPNNLHLSTGGSFFKKNKVTRDHAENENEEERKDEFHADRMINYARRCINTFVLSRRTFSSRVQLSILSCCPSFKNNFIALL